MWNIHYSIRNYIFVKVSACSSCSHSLPHNMARHRETRTTTVADRTLIVWLWERGTPPRTIACNVSTSLTTVYRWIRRWRHGGSLRNKQPIRRPRHSLNDKLIWRRLFSSSSSLREERTLLAQGSSYSLPFQPQHQGLDYD